MDPFVHLSPIIFAITQLQSFMWEKLDLRMSEYLRDEMIVSGLLETNNMYRFSKFAGEMFDAWSLQEDEPIPVGSSFVDCFQIWLRTKYTSNEGTHDRRKVKAGAVHYAPSKNNPTLVSTSYSNIRAFHDQMKASIKQTVSDAEFRRTLKSLDKAIEGAGDLKLQKMIYVRVAVGGDLSFDWLKYCLPGSPQHFSRFVEKGFELGEKSRVGLVVQAFAVVENFP